MRFIPELPKVLSHLPFLILAPIKVIHQLVVILLWLLVWIEIPPEFIVVQVCRNLPFTNISFFTEATPESSKHSNSRVGPTRWQNPRQQGDN